MSRSRELVLPRPFSAAIVLAAAALLSLPAMASAGTAELSGQSLLVTAASGEHNNLFVTRVFDGGFQYAITEEGTDATLTPGNGCVSSGQENQVYCPSDGTTSVKVKTLDGADSTFIQTIGISPSVTVLSGTGNDTIQGGDNTGETIKAGAGNDVLKGGGFADSDPLDVLIGQEGRDKLYGEGGPDQLKAKDGEADKRIDCGDGDDMKALRDKGLDPKPKSC